MFITMNYSKITKNMPPPPGKFKYSSDPHPTPVKFLWISAFVNINLPSDTGPVGACNHRLAGYPIQATRCFWVVFVVVVFLFNTQQITSTSSSLFPPLISKEIPKSLITVYVNCMFSD